LARLDAEIAVSLLAAAGVARVLTEMEFDTTVLLASAFDNENQPLHHE
jgi:hypothetical protein